MKTWSRSLCLIALGVLAGCTGTLPFGAGNGYGEPSVTSSVVELSRDGGTTFEAAEALSHSLSPQADDLTAFETAAGERVYFLVRLISDAGTAVNSFPVSDIQVGFATGSSTATFSELTPFPDGTYHGYFEGAEAGAAATLTLGFRGKSVTTTLPQIKVTPGTISLADSIIEVGNDSVAAGANLTVTLVAKDKYSNRIKTGGLAGISFDASAGGGTFSAVTDHHDGTYTATFSGTIASGGVEIGAALNGRPFTTAKPVISIVAGERSLALSTIDVSSSTVESGNSVTLTLQARDANGNCLTSGGLGVTFSRAGGSSTGTFSGVTDNGNGSYTATFTGVIAGTATTIHANIDGSAVSSTLPSVVVSHGALSAAVSAVSVSAPSVTSGSNSTITLTTKDAVGNLIGSGGESVAFTSSGGAATGTIDTVTDNLDGTYTAHFTGAGVGSGTTIHATINGDPVTSTLPTIGVISGTSSASHTLIAVSAATLNSGDDVDVTVTTKDSSGNPIATGGSSIVFSTSGGGSTGTFDSVVDHNNGTYTAHFTGLLAGSATTIHATLDGTAVTTTLPTVTVSPGAISTSQSLITVSSSSVASDNSIDLTLQAKDLNGNNLTTGGATVLFSNSSGTSTGSFTAVTDNGDGTYTGHFSGVLAGTSTQIHGTIGGVAVSSSAPTVAVIAGTRSLSLSTIGVSSAMVGSGSGVVVTLTAKDAHSNPLTSGGLGVVFTNSGGTSTGSFTSVSDNGDGTYTSTFTGVVAGTATTIHATIDGSVVSSTLPSVSVNAGAISLSHSIVSVSAGTVSNASSVTVTVTAKDLNDNTVTSGGSTVIFSRSGGASTGTFSSVTDHGDGTYTASFTGVVAGTATTLGATIGGVSITSTLPSVTVTPGTVSTSLSTIATDIFYDSNCRPTPYYRNVTIGTDTTSHFTISAKDAASNLISGATVGITMDLTGFTNPGSITIGATTDNGNGTYTITVIASHVSIPLGNTFVYALVNGAQLSANLQLQFSGPTAPCGRVR